MIPKIYLLLFVNVALIIAIVALGSTLGSEMLFRSVRVILKEAQVAYDMSIYAFMAMFSFMVFAHVAMKFVDLKIMFGTVNHITAEVNQQNEDYETDTQRFTDDADFLDKLADDPQTENGGATEVKEDIPPAVPQGGAPKHHKEAHRNKQVEKQSSMSHPSKSMQPALSQGSESRHSKEGAAQRRSETNSVEVGGGERDNKMTESNSLISEK